MIIDIEQTRQSVIVSYVNKDKGISLKSFNVSEYTDGYGYYDYKITDEADPNKESVLRHYHGDAIKKVPAKKFDIEELREFLTTKIPEEDSNEIFESRSMNGYALDIEIDLRNNEDEIFPDPNLAEHPICTIQITAPNYNTITLTADHDRINPKEDDQYIEDKINEHFSDDIRRKFNLPDRITYNTITFENEKELLLFFFKKVKELMHFTFWWNGDGFDVPYISNRCSKLGIDMGLAGSPTEQATHSWGSRIDWWPKHRLTEDYMAVLNVSAFDIWPRESLALDWISNFIFGIGKVPYDGTFRDMYLGDYRDFLYYSAIDVVLLQMIHQTKNYMGMQESLAYYCRVPIKDTWKTTALGHALIWDDLWKDNKINAADFVKKEKSSYGGGFVKQPVEKFVEYPICSDFSALYPRIMMSHNMSFESFVKKAESKQEAKEYFDKGYYVSVDGNIYQNDKEYTIKRIETSLKAERDISKNMANDVLTHVIPSIQTEMKRRGLSIDKSKLSI